MKFYIGTLCHGTEIFHPEKNLEFNFSTVMYLSTYLYLRLLMLYLINIYIVYSRNIQFLDLVRNKNTSINKNSSYHRVVVKVAE